MRKIISLVATAVIALSAFAETKPFQHLDIGVTASTTGFGIDLGVPVCDYVRVRAGVTSMPKFRLKSDFGLSSSEGLPISQSGVEKITKMLGGMTGANVDDVVSMNMEPKFTQFKFMVDITPFRNNKHWNLTLGFYIGPSTVGKAVNMQEESTTLLGVSMYNYMYINSCQQKSMFGDMKIGDIDLSGIGELPESYLKRGIMGMPLGYFADGSKAMLVPDGNSMVSAEMQVSRFRPYVGIGYTTALSRDHRWQLAVDAGVMFLGGKPKVFVDNVYKISPDYKSLGCDPEKAYDIVRKIEEPHIVNVYDEHGVLVDQYWSDPVYEVDKPLQHVDMVNDLNDIKGKVGDMVKTVKKFRCYPNLSLTLSYRIPFK